MIPFLLITSLMLNPGAPPTDWQPLGGVTGVHYRWSRPTSNSCLVEFEGAADPGVLQFQVTAKVLNTEPKGPIEYNPDSPMQIESTKIKPQLEDRAFPMRLVRFGRDNRDIHNCYGVLGIRAMTGSHAPNATGQPLSETKSGSTQ
jgi:hypothetical protein